jgi:hypothetical protein
VGGRAVVFCQVDGFGGIVRLKPADELDRGTSECVDVLVVIADSNNAHVFILIDQCVDQGKFILVHILRFVNDQDSLGNPAHLHFIVLVQPQVVREGGLDDVAADRPGGDCLPLGGPGRHRLAGATRRPLVQPGVSGRLGAGYLIRQPQYSEAPRLT